jgi:hypothetical protein
MCAVICFYSYIVRSFQFSPVLHDIHLYSALLIVISLNSIVYYYCYYCTLLLLLTAVLQEPWVVSSVRDIPAEEKKGKVFIEYFPYDDDKLWMQAWVPRSELIPYNGVSAGTTTAAGATTATTAGATAAAAGAAAAAAGAAAASGDSSDGDFNTAQQQHEEQEPLQRTR